MKIPARAQDWIAALLVTFTCWALIGAACIAYGAEPPVAKPAAALTGWVHVFGCPRKDNDDDTNAYIILTFADGHLFVLPQHELSAAQKAKLTALIGDMDGTNLMFQCGSIA